MLLAVSVISLHMYQRRQDKLKRTTRDIEELRRLSQHLTAQLDLIRDARSTMRNPESPQA